MSVLELREVSVQFGSGSRIVRAVDNVSFAVETGSVVGLVGESGSGKSTLAKAIVGLIPLRTGGIFWDGDLIRAQSRRSIQALGSTAERVQYIFQDPYASLDPRMKVGDSIAEGFIVRRDIPRVQRDSEVVRLLDMVRLDGDARHALPRELSGGQRQRVAIARALACRPRILIADEITSSLDVSIQGAVLNVIKDVQRETGVGVLFISHNLAVVRYLADTIAVMHSGRIVESGRTEDVAEHPREVYTQELLAAVPSIRDSM